MKSNYKKLRIRQYAKAMNTSVRRDKKGYHFKIQDNGFICNTQLDMKLYEPHGWGDAFDKKECFFRLRALSICFRKK